MTSAMASRSINKCTVDKYTHHHSICDFKMRNISDVVGMCKQTSFNKGLPSHLFAHTTAYRRCGSFVPRIRHFVNTDPRRRVSRRNGGDGVTKPTVAPNGGPLTLTQYLRLLKIVHNGEILPIVPWAFFEKYKWFDHVFQRAEDVFQTIPLFLLSAPKLNNVHTIWGHHQGSKGIIPKYNNRQLLWGCETNQGWKGWGWELHHLLFLVAVLFFPRKT